MTPEEQLLNELLDESKAGSINQTIKVYPDASRIDETKTSGRRHRALLSSIITRIKAWVVVLLASKSNVGHGHTIGEVDNLQTTLNGHNQRITDNTNALGAKADLENGKVPLSQLPPIESGGSVASPLEFTTALPFDKDYLVNWQVPGPTAYTKNALDFKPGKIIRGNIKANGVNKPTFSADFIMNQYEWVNTAGKQHRFFAEAQADGKIIIDIVDA